MDRSWFAVYLTLGCLVAGVLPQYREKNTRLIKRNRSHGGVLVMVVVVKHIDGKRQQQHLPFVMRVPLRTPF
ncbi:hypothetical protein M0804_006594 [Polistes exclamans]|nr:hypothetical protein M0804_006594 [Polistes exclamans]